MLNEEIFLNLLKIRKNKIGNDKKEVQVLVMKYLENFIKPR